MNYNIVAFSSHNSQNYLLQIYCRLVECELILKDMLGAASNRHGHDLLTMIHKAASRKLIQAGGANVVRSLLEQHLQALWCNSKSGGPAPVPPNNYPYIRYLRHQSDFDSEFVAEEELKALNLATVRFKNALKRV